MSTALRSYFSGRRVRYIDHDFNLDLTYISDRVIAMGFPSTKFESFYRNNIADVAKMLSTKHGKHYMVFNLSGRDYDYGYFGNRVIEAGFPDHHSPPIALMWAIYSFIDLWLAVDPNNVVAAHCLAGKGRTGITICCTLLMQGFFNQLDAKTTTEYVNAAVNYFREKRGDGVENPDQIKFIRDFLVSTDTIGADNSMQFDSKLQPSLYLGSLVLYNIPVGVGGIISLSLVVFSKYRNEWNVVYNSAWSYFPLPRYNSYQSEIVIDINTIARGDLLFQLKNEKDEVFHVSINTTQVPCCTTTDLTSLYFSKNNLSIAKSALPLTQSFSAQLICLDKTAFEKHTAEKRLEAIQAVTRQAIEEERSRREALLSLRKTAGDEASPVVCSIQYRDLLDLNLAIFHMSPVSSEIGYSRDAAESYDGESFVSGEDVPALPYHTMVDSLPPYLGAMTVTAGGEMSDEVKPRCDSLSLGVIASSTPQTTLASTNSLPLVLLPPAPTPSPYLDAQTTPPLLPQYSLSCSPSFVPICRLDSDQSAGSHSPPSLGVKLRTQSNHCVANPYNDNFAQRIPFLKQLSLSYGEEVCSQANGLSLSLPPQKEKKSKKVRGLTMEEKQLLSKEDIAFALCGMEDQEIRILTCYDPRTLDPTHQSVLDYVISQPHILPDTPCLSPGGVCGSYVDTPPATVVFKVFASVFEKRVWKRRLLVLTNTALLIMKRPHDHYLKRTVFYHDAGAPVAYPSKKEGETWTVLLPSTDIDLHFLFDSFSDLMIFIGITRHLEHLPDFTVTYPIDCSDADLCKDIAAMIYLYYPQRGGDTAGIYNMCVGFPDRYEQWVRTQFNLCSNLCRNLHILNTVEEVEELITADRQIMPSEIYLKPHYIEVLTIPKPVLEVVRQLQQLTKEDIWVRLVQVCQFAYPSPLPLVRAIIDLRNEDWAKMFDKDPYAFLMAIRESKSYRKESYLNRSYKRPHVMPGRLGLMSAVPE